jgi:hypothetical protein
MVGLMKLLQEIHPYRIGHRETGLKIFFVLMIKDWRWVSSKNCLTKKGPIDNNMKTSFKGDRFGELPEACGDYGDRSGYTGWHRERGLLDEFNPGQIFFSTDHFSQ